MIYVISYCNKMKPLFATHFPDSKESEAELKMDYLLSEDKVKVVQMINVAKINQKYVPRVEQAKRDAITSYLPYQEAISSKAKKFGYVMKEVYNE